MVNYCLKAVILAGGFATRLRPLSCTRPKILLPIVNKPLLQWTFERLESNHVEEVILAVNHQTEFLVRQCEIPKHGLQVKFSRDPPNKPLGTGGPIKKAERYVGRDSPFLVLNGDIFADVNYKEMLKLHEKKNGMATIALHEVGDPSRYGVVETGKDNVIKKFIEKPRSSKAKSSMINAGVYILDPAILERLPRNRTISMEREIFPALAKEGKLYGYIYDGLWTDIGTPEDYFEINRILMERTLEQPNIVVDKTVGIKKPVAFDASVTLGRRSIIGPNVVLGEAVSVGNGVRIRESILLGRTEICDNASIDGSIVGEGVVIGDSAKISKGCIIGDYAKIGNKIVLGERVSVCPAKEISENVLDSSNIC